MVTNYQALPDSTRVWIYQSNRPILGREAQQLNERIEQFVDGWVSHNQALRAFGKLFHDRFVVLMVDESLAGASGCSIDKSVKFVQYLEETFQLSLFDRLTFAYQADGAVQTAARDDFARLYQEGVIGDDTLVFDNLVQTKGDFEAKWKKPLAESWHARMV